MDIDELRLVLTVPDFDAAVVFYREALGLPELADWSSDNGRVVLLEAGRATIELNDERHAGEIDAIEVGHRVAGHVQVAFELPTAPPRQETWRPPEASWWHHRS